jgi:glyoxylase-like metal-dependent hydrolase (beta-lactamase superfamily II)
MTIEQIKIGFDNFSYIIYDKPSKKAAVVDPSYNALKQVEFIKSHNLELVYVINTHYHSDHTDKNKRLLDTFPQSKLVASKTDGFYLKYIVDVLVNDGDQLKLGELALSFISTPGHTPGGISVVVNDEAILTGDTLFIDDCGRADLPGGNVNDLFHSLQKIKILPDHLKLFPGHDYGSKPYDTIGNQKKTNKTLVAKNIEEFSKIP